MNRAWIELDRGALARNLADIKSKLRPHTEIMAVVKANAYGHGAVYIAPAMEEMGIRHFAVASLDEAIELRENRVKSPILILGGTDVSHAVEIIEHDLTQTIGSVAYARALNDAVEDHIRRYGPEGRDLKLRTHLAIDTGMHRLGVEPHDLKGIKEIYALPHLRIDGCFSHLCAAGSFEEDDVRFTNRQISLFNECVEMIKEAGLDPGVTHLQNSLAIAFYPGIDCDLARPGAIMYGFRSVASEAYIDGFDLQPVMSLRTRVMSLRWVEDGKTVGYDRMFKAEGRRRIATVGIGYGDGIPRSLSGGLLEGIVHGVRVKGAGKVCMDQAMFDVTDVPEIKEGDIVTLIGRDGEEYASAAELANRSGTITDELVCRLGRRIENRGFV